MPISPDGGRFRMIQRDPGSVPRQLNVILNWSEELDRLTPGAIGNLHFLRDLIEQSARINKTIDTLHARV